jgi:hypothetical protein
MEWITPKRVPQANIAVMFFVYYFAGLVISRVGSLLLEPAMKWIGFVRFASYKDFVSATRKDSKIEVLSEQNNVYRTLCTMLVGLALLKAYDVAVPLWNLPGRTIVGIALFLLFAFSYRKQVEYIRQRVELAKRD